jgi:hypothetical protein
MVFGERHRIRRLHVVAAIGRWRADRGRLVKGRLDAFEAVGYEALVARKAVDARPCDAVARWTRQSRLGWTLSLGEVAEPSLRKRDIGVNQNSSYAMLLVETPASASILRHALIIIGGPHR